MSHHTLASNSSRSNSFSASARGGNGGFGSVSERAEWGGPGRLGPGPLGYNARPSWMDEDAKHGRKSLGFAATSARINWIKFRDTPGFSGYRPEDCHAKLEARGLGGDSLRSRTPRFPSDATVSPGPAGHVPNHHTLARAASERMRDARQFSATREDLFRPPRVRVMVKPKSARGREAVRV